MNSLPKHLSTANRQRLILAGRVNKGTLRFSLACLSLTMLCYGCSTPATLPTGSSPIASLTPIRLGSTETATPVQPSPTVPPPLPTLASILPVSENDWIRGSPNAPITLLIYSDFQCPHCRDLSLLLTEIEQMHPDEVRIFYRHFPLLPIHDKASLASQAAEAAGAQGYFWKMSAMLFERQPEWAQLSPQAFLEWLGENLEDLALNQDQLLQDLNEGVFASKIEQDFYSAISAGLVGTPTIFINGKLLQYAPTLSILEAALRLELLENQKWDDYPASMITLGVNYFAHLNFNLGEVVIQLFPDTAPLAVNSFVFLSRQGWYDNNPIFRVVPKVLVEMGDPSGTGLGDPGYHYPLEIDPALRFDQAGLVALSSSGPDTNGSQFFITLAPLPELNNTHTIIGRVIEGLEILTQLQARDALDDLLIPPEGILQSITIEEQ